MVAPWPTLTIYITVVKVGHDEQASTSTHVQVFLLFSYWKLNLFSPETIIAIVGINGICRKIPVMRREEEKCYSV